MLQGIKNTDYRLKSLIMIREILSNHPFIPVVILDDLALALPLADALTAGGISILEITLRTKTALDVIKTLRQERPKLIIGAGTILNENQLFDASAAGAHFAVSPGYTLNLLNKAHEKKIPYLPGAITPTEIMQVIATGYDTLKFFPANAANGFERLSQYTSVFPEIKFCPTGGISSDNLLKFYHLPNVISVGASWVVKPTLIKEQAWEKISQLAKEVMNMISSS